MSLDDAPRGWEVWSDEPDKVVLAYRPDVFDGGDLPPQCMPTLYLTRGRRDRRPGGQRAGASWYVTLYLEPEVDREVGSYPTRAEAEDAATDVAADFDAGEVDHRDFYQVPREEYLDRLDELTGRDDGG
ncbi:DUF5820 family protein [Halomicrobium salinisoli]|uniref:DUF5820 family protein n=1 Tax=Halomicrobium salinisoli TaxID=2878391 RepID=UPI001CEFE2A5|nr:DUF5820 family protein [Halomicrobium salinisoli]